jgi:WD40-like Beta Propeller Repeat
LKEPSLPRVSRHTLRGVALLAAAVTLIASVHAQAPRPAYDSGTPITQPTLFAPGVISTDLDESGGVFSPDGRDFYFTLVAPYTTAPRFAMLVVSHFQNGHWQLPETLPFSGKSFDIAPHLSADGARLYFASARPTQQSKVPHIRIWVSERNAGTWSEPAPLPEPINQDTNDNLDPALASDGSLYFASDRNDPAGHLHIFFSRWDGAKFAAPEKLGLEINSEFSESAPAISPDGQTLVFASSAAPEDPERRRPQDLIAAGKPYPRQDLYVSFKRDGRWTPARHLEHGINSFAEEVYPAFSPDGKFLFWGSERSSFEIPTKPLDRAQIDRLWSTPLNGRGNIFFISADVFADSSNAKP